MKQVRHGFRKQFFKGQVDRADRTVEIDRAEQIGDTERQRIGKIGLLPGWKASMVNCRVAGEFSRRSVQGNLFRSGAGPRGDSIGDD